MSRASWVSIRATGPMLTLTYITLAVAGFTTGSAYINHLDQDTGTLEVGKYADLAVLDRDRFDRRAGSLHDASVIGTFVEGVPVYETPALDD